MRALLAVASLALVPATGCAPPAQVADLGELALESGQTIHECRVAYRTFGRLDATGSNAVLVAPWFLGTSRQLARQIGPGGLVDSSRYFVVAVDAIANGVSSSPSNAADQRGADFPRFSIRDLVEIQHRVVTEVLRIAHLRAVVGVSFGAMQVFEWTVSHPGLMDRAVAIAGTPVLTERDRQRWRQEAQAFRARPRWRRFFDGIRRGAPASALEDALVDETDYERQAEALIGQDVTARFGGSLRRAAEAVRAPLLVVVAKGDPVLDPAPARSFASMAGAALLELDGRCGHRAPSCERATLWPAVDRFLAGREPQTVARP